MPETWTATGRLRGLSNPVLTHGIVNAAGDIENLFRGQTSGPIMCPWVDATEYLQHL